MTRERRPAGRPQRRHRGLLHGRQAARRAAAPPARGRLAGRHAGRAWSRAPAGPTSCTATTPWPTLGRGRVLHAGRPTVVTVGAGAAPVAAKPRRRSREPLDRRRLAPQAEPATVALKSQRRTRGAAQRAAQPTTSSLVHDPRRSRIVHPLQVHRLRRCLPGRLLPRGPELPDHRPRRVHRLRGVHSRMPGQRDRARGRRAGRPAAHDQAQRRPGQEVAQYHQAQAGAARCRRVERPHRQAGRSP